MTFVFTDVEGSTRLLEELGEAAFATALLEHRRVVRDACARNGGVEVDTQGDAFLLAFPTAPGALATASEVQEALRGGRVRLRVGLHTGTPLLTDEGYVGVDLHRAARIGAAGHGGQVLLSSSTAALVGQDGLVDLGERRFKDLAAPERIYQVGEAEFPPLKSLYRTNLPVPASPFQGREVELASVAELLGREEVRLVTLTGPGGTGKTRLGLQAAAEAAERFPDGLFWVALAPLREPALLLPGIAQALELKEQPGQPLPETLQTALMGRRMLLFLDNAEHLLPDLASELTPVLAITGPSILVTSRERLQLGGEHVYQVPSLNTEDAAALFLTRAAQQGVSLGRTAAISELCRRLDELPLALELAAARTALFSPAQLLERLAERLDLLKGGRDADPRQQTLRATIQWSYGLLAEEEQRLFRQLSVFLGGCTFEAAEEILGAEPDTLQSLLDKSLLRRRDSSAGHRYWMLETIREFAGEGLDGSGEAEDVARRHAGWYSRLGIDLHRALRHHDSEAVARLEDELANMQAGLAHALARRDVALAGDFLWGLWYLWLTRGHGEEAASAARAWLALDRSALEPLARIPGLLAAGELIRFTGEYHRAATLKHELMAITRENPDAVVYGWNLRTMLPALLTDLAAIELDEGRLDEAEACAKEALDLRRAEGTASGIAHAQMAMSEISYARRDFAGARTIRLEAFAGWEKDARLVEAAIAQTMIAECDVLLGEVESAESRLARWLPSLARDLQTSANVVEVAAVLAATRGEMERASRLAGAAEHLGSTSGVIWRSPYEVAVRGEILARARYAVGEDAYRRAFTEGEALAEPDALKLVAETVGT